MRTKKSFLNLLTDLIPLVIISILGIFKLKLFIDVLGDKTLGLYQLYSQVMVYVALVDGGLSSALLFALYKPNSSGNTEKFKEIVAAGYKVFALIGVIIFGLTAILSPFVHYLIKDTIFSNWFVAITFLIFALSNVVEYFFVPQRTILEVKEKKYVLNICIQNGQILLSIAEIIMLLLHCKFIYILLMHVVIRLLSNIAVAICCKKIYPEYSVKGLTKKDFEFTKQIKHLIFHKINGLVVYNIDVILISSILGLSAVAIYSTYNYVINMLRNILGKISGSITAIIGNYLSEGNEKKSHELFDEMRSMMFFVAIIISVPLFFALGSFIDIWYEGKIETQFLITLAFSIYMYVYIIKIPTTTFVTSAGLFKETKLSALCDTIINLTLSLLLIFKTGISGVVFATAFSSFVAEYIMKTNVLYKHVFTKKKSTEFYRKNIKFLIFTLFDLLIGYLIFMNIKITNILSWFLIFVLYFIINAILIYVVFYIFKETKFINRFKCLLKKETN